MSTATVTESNRGKVQYDLGVPLFHSRWTFEHAIPPYTLLYSPDSPGLPILVTTHVKRIYDAFRSGATLGEVSAALHSTASFTDCLTVTNDLVERGFLREQLDPPHFSPKPQPPSMKGMNIWLHINNYCNLACSYCFVDHTKAHMKEDTIDATVALIGKTAREHGVNDILVKFAGGEPTLTLPQMEYFYDRLTEEMADTGAYLHYAVLTNGTNVTSRFIEFVRRAPATVSISVDGYGDYHDKYRIFRTNERLPMVPTSTHGKGSWEVVNKNIDVLRRNGIVPYINAMVGPKTSKGLPELAEWIFGSGMIGTIHVVRNIDDSWERGAHRARQYQQYCDQLAEDFERMFQVLEAERFHINLPRWMEIAELTFDTPAPDVCCGIGTDHIVIKHDGTLASCPMTVHEQTVIPIDDLFKSAKATFDASPDRRGGSECLSCEWFKVCASACPVANERLGGHAFMQSPLCQFWKYVIPRYVIFYGRKLAQALNGSGPAVWNGMQPRL